MPHHASSRWVTCVNSSNHINATDSWKMNHSAHGTITKGIFTIFYRATLCVGAVFAVGRCPSVCLSVCHVRVYIIQTSEDNVKFLYRPGRSIILVFNSEHQYPIPREIHSAGVQNTLGVGKICDFRLKSPSISETVRVGLMVATKR